VAKRGDVLVAKRKLGFGADGKAEHFVVVQSDKLRDLDTVIVAPLDADGHLYEDDPLVVHVTAKEIGARAAHVVLVHLLTATLLDRFEPEPAGKLSPSSLDAVDTLVRVVLQVT
jgi:hypothetical protein